MKYKTPEVEAGYKGAAPKLKEVALYYEWLCLALFNWPAVMTASSRTHAESMDIYAGKVVNPKTGELYTEEEVPYSVHEFFRGSDMRALPHHEDNVMLADRINEKYIYDPARPNLKVCRFHKVGNGGEHFHLQVHNKTRLRKPAEV